MTIRSGEISVSFVLVLIGVVLIFVSAFVPSLATRRDPPSSVSLWNLGWGFVLAGALLIGK